MIVLKVLLIGIVIFILGFLAGRLINRFIIKDERFGYSFVWGLVFQFSLFEIISVGCSFAGRSFSMLVAIYVLSQLFVALALLVANVKHKNTEESQSMRYACRKRIKSLNRLHLFLFALVFCFTVLIGGYLSLYSKTNEDDGAYIAQANIAYEQDLIEHNTRVAYSGMEGLEHFEPPVASWELFIAFLAVVCKEKPVVVAHTILPIILVMIEAIVYGGVCYKLLSIGVKSKEKNKWLELTLIAMLLHQVLMIFHKSNAFDTIYMLSVPWVGKSVLLSIMLPLLLDTVIDVYEDSFRTPQVIKFILIFISGIFASSTGLFLIPISYVSFIVVYCFWKFRERDYLHLKKVLIPNIYVGSIGLALAAILVFVIRNSSSEEISYAEKFNLRETLFFWLKSFYYAWDKNIVIYIFIAGLVLICLVGDKTLKIMSLGNVVFLMMTFLNPFLAYYITSYVTSSDVYWRLWFLVYAAELIPIGVTALIDYIEEKGVFVFLVGMVLLAISGGYPKIDLSNNNIYHLSGKVVENAQYLLSKCYENNEDICILAEEDAYQYRQYSALIKVPFARKAHLNSDRIKYQDYDYLEMYNTIYENNLVDGNAYSALKSVGINYIIVTHEIDIDSIYGKLKKHMENGNYIYEIN